MTVSIPSIVYLAQSEMMILIHDDFRDRDVAREIPHLRGHSLQVALIESGLC